MRHYSKSAGLCVVLAVVVSLGCGDGEHGDVERQDGSSFGGTSDSQHEGGNPSVSGSGGRADCSLECVSSPQGSATVGGRGVVLTENGGTASLVSGGNGGTFVDGGSIATGGVFSSTSSTTVVELCPVVGRELYCDDGNICTLDRCDPVQGCIYEDFNEGLACDSHDVCITDARCRTGHCEGTRVSSEGKVLGQLESFGALEETPESSPNLRAFLSENLAVYADSLSHFYLKLVDLDATDAQLRSRTLTAGAYVTAASFFGTELGTHLVRLSESRLALLTTRGYLEIYDVVDGRLFLRAYEAMPSDGFVTAAAGNEQKVWCCLDSKLQSFGIESDGTISVSESVYAPWDCNGLALAEDGKELYVTNSKGIDVYDVSDRPIALLERTLPNVEVESRPWNVTVHGDMLLVQRRELYWGTGDIEVYRIKDWQLIAQFTRGKGGEDDSVGVLEGANWLDSNLLIQRKRYQNGRAEFSVEVYDLSIGAPKLLSSWVFWAGQLANSTEDLLQPPVTFGNSAILGWTSQLIRFDSGRIIPVNSKNQGNWGWLKEHGDRRVVSVGPNTSHLFDVSNPRAPAIVSGGMIEPGTFEKTRVSLGQSASSDDGLLFGDPSLFSKGINECFVRTPPGRPLEVSQLTLNGVGAPSAVGKFKLFGGTSRIYVTNGVAYQLFSGDGGHCRLTSALLPVSPLDGNPLPILDDVLIEESCDNGIPKYAVDPQSRMLVLVVPRDTVGTGQPVNVTWYSRDSGRWEKVAFGGVTASFGECDAIAIHGSIALIISDGGTRLELLRFSDGAVNSIASRNFRAQVDDTNRTIQNVLGTIGNRAYLGSRSKNTLGNNIDVVSEISLEDLTLIADYTIQELPSSVVKVGSHLAIGTPNNVIIATPHCALTDKAPVIPLLGDLDGNGCVDRNDWIVVSENYGGKSSDISFNASADINGDGVVDVNDAWLLIENFNIGCQ